MVRPVVVVMAIVVAALSLRGLIGGFGLLMRAPLWVLTRPETEAIFRRRRYQPGY